MLAQSQRERAAGRYACFAVVPDGGDAAVGLFQVRQLEGIIRSSRAWTCFRCAHSCCQLDDVGPDNPILRAEDQVVDAAQETGGIVGTACVETSLVTTVAVGARIRNTRLSQFSSE